MDYVFMTDSDSDLPYELKVKYDIPVVYMPYALDGKEYFDDLGQTLDHKSYYDRMRNGAIPVTSALNEETYLQYFEPILKEKDLLFAAFSSKLSSTIQAVYSAQKKLLEKYPERKFIVVDTLSISTPQALLVLKAHELYRAGKPMEEVADWLEANKLRSQAYFIVDDLKYLKRGGRISATAATVGTMLDLKPIISAVYEQQIAPYIQDFHLVDYCIEWGKTDIGWISFTGTPVKSLNWLRVPSDKGEVYCRSVCVTQDENGLPTALQSFDMLPIRKLDMSKNIGTEEEPDWIWLRNAQKTIASAALYVQQTGKNYTISDPTSLEALALMLKDDDTISWDAEDCRFNPLYLTFTDGSHAMVFTAASGANAFCAKYEFSDLDSLISGCGSFGNMDAAIFEKLGFQVTAVAPWDCYDSLQRGLIDATQMGFTPMVSMQWYQVAPYWALDGTYSAGNFVAANLSWWNTLSEDQQEIIRTASQEVSDWSMALYDEAIAEDVATVEEATGIPFVQFSDEDVARIWAATFDAKAEAALSAAEPNGKTEGMIKILQVCADVTGYDWQP